MASKTHLVNLDAMIKRADFASEENNETTFETITTISLRDITQGGLIGPILRKPDFQRETNHWTPEQVVSLLECFINGDLIPSVILWKSPSYLFVIDGGHRLSALKAWVEDDYGDGPTSHQYFDNEISNSQKKAADKTRKMINDSIGSWQHFISKSLDENIPPTERIKVTTISTRGLPIQWVTGNADKAESSFFKINTEGTPLDEIEELLLRNRKKPIPIAARAIIRAGKGHKYWSSFEKDKAESIEKISRDLHSILFDPEIKRPIKTLDLPLGGSKGVRSALQILIDILLIANQNQQAAPKIEDYANDDTGELTISVLKKALRLAGRITGNDKGSLGLHPAVYFYGPSGHHSSAMFLGTVVLFGKKLSNNDKAFFNKYSSVRSKLETVLIENKDLIATILQKHISTKRVESYCKLLENIINHIDNGDCITEENLVAFSNLQGKIVLGDVKGENKTFSDHSKSKAFITTALSSAIKCPICDGYLDVEKSVSYDHIIPVRDEGTGNVDNCQLTHPYCNQSIKQ